MFARLGLAFATATSGDLTLPRTANSPAHSSKGTPSPRPGCPGTRLRPLVGTRFQVLFHSPPGVLFTFPSRYWCTIGHRGVFSLGGWSPRFHAGLHVSRVTRDAARGRTRRLTGLSPSVAGRSRPLRRGVVLPCRGPPTPGGQDPPVWAGPVFLAPTFRVAVGFSSSGAWQL